MNKALHDLVESYADIFQKIGQNGRPGRREPPPRALVDVYHCLFKRDVVFFVVFVGCFFKESVKTAVLEDGRRPRALVLTKLVE